MRRYFATNHSGIDPLTYTPLNKDNTSDGWDYYGPHTSTGGTSPTRYQVYKWELAILSHPEVQTYVERKAADPDRWLKGMRRLRARSLDLRDGS